MTCRQAEKVNGMNVNTKRLLISTLAVCSLFTACGGSSDDGAGQLTNFQAANDDISYGTGTNACPGGQKVGDVTIVGGTAPYQVQNPNTGFISFAPGLTTATPATPGANYTIPNRNGQVAVFAFGCFEGDVSVLDAQGRVATFSVTAASGSAS